MVFWWENLEYTRRFDPNYGEPASDGDRKVTLEFGFRTADEVDAMYDTLLAAGAPDYQSPISWNNGDIRFAMVVDPDDNQIALRWPLVS